MYCDPMQPLVVDIGSGTSSEAPKHLFFYFFKSNRVCNYWFFPDVWIMNDR